jgi:hypothetical protein
MYETEDTENGLYDEKRDYPWYKIQLLLKVLKTRNMILSYGTMLIV